MFCITNRIRVVFAFNVLAGILFACQVILPAGAQNSGGMPFSSPTGIYSPAGIAPPEGPAPPQGSGPTSPPVTSGDQGTSPLVPNASPTPNVPEHGTNLEYSELAPKSRVNLLVDAGDGRGTRVALTFDASQLTNSQRGQIEGQLGLGSGALSSSQPYQNIDSSVEQIESIQKILYPPPGTGGSIYRYSGTPAPGDTIRGTPQTTERSYIDTDQPGQGYPRYTNQEIKSPRQPIREFSRYLVLKGAVVACIMLIFAAAGVIFGAQHAGGKVIAAAAGLILLFMAFAIWKVDMYNALNARGQPQGGAEAPDSFDITSPPLSATEQVTGAPRYEGDMTLSQDQKKEAAILHIPAPICR